MSMSAQELKDWLNELAQRPGLRSLDDIEVRVMIETTDEDGNPSTQYEEELTDMAFCSPKNGQDHIILMHEVEE